ncbi:probable ATP-dependent RNA helicase DDX10 [Macrosteles quadrilineatus]|uniref:probable ATP-dependent RNA helicase DDX10 n=1 Tax=Macrosteles quadrilineatus TaxID=74068 RepID=UPI0023E19A3D|nr:probable ATP-dependent RNA helicase DDX10 [Macrosteles quadrilineatus]
MKAKDKNKNRNKEKVKVFSKKKTFDHFDKVIKKLESAKIDISQVRTFTDLPLSPPTQKGLSENGFEIPTEIQKESLVYSLQGMDILGAAKTGSGKTLAFLVPILETLFKKKWTRMDGVGAVVITPTRELAYQIFETLRKVGFHHDFSAGLIIGGKDLHFEKHRMDRVNIVICTPGRLLQHMDENPLFDCVNMQILVLDEADRCLDLGFEKTMNSIIENLPLNRQTLLFSATQTKSVRDLARLSLKDPKYVSVHENAQYSTPDGLTQNFVVCELHDKMAFLWSFIKNHSKHKILVFLSSCKQVKYMFEILCKLRPANALLALYGTLHQERRMKIYNAFTHKQHAVLLATDIAARGLDFPEVNWVIQLDCPEDANTYIHRAGRTARYHKGGESLLVLLPSERDTVLKHLEEKKIPINEIKVNPMKLTNPQVKMEAFLARDPNLKASAQRAFVAYFKSVFLMKDKEVFDINALNPDTFARSLGLVVSPRIRFLNKYKNQIQNAKKSRDELPSLETKDSDESDNDLPRANVIQPPKEVPKGKETYNFGGDDSESDNEFLTIKRQDHQLEVDEKDEITDLLEQMQNKSKKKPLTKAALAKKVLKKKIIPNKKIVFDETGETQEDQMKARTTEEGRQYEAAAEGGIDIAEAQKVMRAEDKIDRKLFREKIKAKHREQRLKEKKIKKKKDKEDEDEVEVKLYSGSDSEGSGPDLSWLPDPDKVFGEKGTRESDNEDSAEESVDEAEVERSKSRSQKKPEKRKRNSKKEPKSKKVKRLEEDENISEDEPPDTGLSLVEDEELVLRFLSDKT